MSTTLEETATVLRVEGDSAWVAIRSRSACGHCGASGECGTAMVAKLFGEKQNELRLDNHLGLQPGDRVVIGVSNKLLLKASMLAYLLPLLSLIGGVALGGWLGMSDEMGTLLGFIGLGLGLWVVNFITGGAEGRRDYCPVMLRRANPEFMTGQIEFITPRITS